jgi:hypothetical protein
LKSTSEMDVISVPPVSVLGNQIRRLRIKRPVFLYASEQRCLSTPQLP